MHGRGPRLVAAPGASMALQMVLQWYLKGAAWWGCNRAAMGLEWGWLSMRVSKGSVGPAGEVS